MEMLPVKSPEACQNQSSVFDGYLSSQKVMSFLPHRIDLENGDTELIDLQAADNFIYLSSGKKIIGSSMAMQEIAKNIAQVAAYDSTILIFGETGTGKELIAQAIHESSPRREKPIIKINCASLPANLIESELFGHERGSFTGAIERRIGKFELADRGTLFLDEIGEIPLELQAKLLRAIQEKEIERIGGRTTIKTDVRIVAATNRNLQEETSAGRFRIDLFYRLNVFPLNLAPLRERREDISPLAYYFVEKYSQKFNKDIYRIGEHAMQKLLNHDFPGNVRELENLIERSILLANGNFIADIQLPTAEHSKNKTGNSRLKTYEENERDHILSALLCCNGKVSGPGGAAEALNLNVSTLKSKIKKLKIKKEYCDI